jgi:hypothetical protein
MDVYRQPAALAHAYQLFREAAAEAKHRIGRHASGRRLEGTDLFASLSSRHQSRVSLKNIWLRQAKKETCDETCYELGCGKPGCSGFAQDANWRRGI